MIYESRLNIGADAGTLCLKSGNAVIFRGGRGLIELIRGEARVPTLLQLNGNCHNYVHFDADLDKAADIVNNAKICRTGVFGAAESLVVDAAIAVKFLPRLVDALAGCGIRGDEIAQRCDPSIKITTDFDWDTVCLDTILSVKSVENLKEALTFVDRHSSRHTDGIITENADAAESFLQVIDSEVVTHHTSTHFSDGGEFGIGPRSVSPRGNTRSWPRGPGTIDQFQMADRWSRPDSNLNQFLPLPL
ncbi:MAG: hypothetical protein ABIR84_06650 [Candidatus Nitrotoga sp.]